MGVCLKPSATFDKRHHMGSRNHDDTCQRERPPAETIEREIRAGNAAGRFGTGRALKLIAYMLPHLKHMACDPDLEGDSADYMHAIQQAHFRDVALIGSITKK
jgi:hypothetical protein